MVIKAVRCLGPLLLIMVLCAGCKDEPLHEKPLEAIEQCLGGIEEIEKGGMGTGSKMALLANACKDLYVEPDCRKAFENIGSVPLPKQAVSIAEVCRKSYCPKLKDPKPRMCELAGLPNSPFRLLALWHELQWAIFNRDLGADNASRLYSRLVFTRLALQPIMHTSKAIQVPVTAAAEKPAPTEPVPAVDQPGMTGKKDGLESSGPVVINISKQGDSLMMDLAGGVTMTFAGKADDKSLKPLIEALEKGGKQRKVLIKATPGVEHETVVVLLDALKAAGFSKFGLVNPEKGKGE